MNEEADQETKQTKPNSTFTNIWLFILTLAVIWLAFDNGSPPVEGSAYMQNSDGGYTTIESRFGNFPVSVSETKPIGDGTEITLKIINPLVIHFLDAKVSVDANGTLESKTVNLAPNANTAKFKVAPLKRGDPIRISLELDKIGFK